MKRLPRRYAPRNDSGDTTLVVLIAGKKYSICIQSKVALAVSNIPRRKWNVRLKARFLPFNVG